MKRAVRRRYQQTLSHESLEARRLLAADPVITEFMASNQSTVYDGNGNTSDWVELFNPGNEPLDLTGYRLTDDPANNSKWTFPRVQLEPKGYLVVFASGDDLTGPAGDLHTNFKLSAGGEYLALVAPDGSVLSEYGSPTESFPPQYGDMSFGTAQTRVVISAENAAHYLVPTEAIGTDWTQPVYDALANGFLPGHAAVGYEDRPDSLTNFDDRIRTRLPAGSPTVYTRIEFQLLQASAIETLSLRMHYDDGFVAYLNGQVVLSENVPEDLDWSSRAVASHRDRSAMEGEEFDLTEQTGVLFDGTNVLAIHALTSSGDAKDIVSSPHVIAGTLDMGRAFGEQAQVGYIAAPSPGAANAGNDLVYDGLATETMPDTEAGFYDQPFQVQLTNQTPGATVRYTTDGSRPTAASGLEYSGPITISASTVLRAAAFRDEYIPGPIATRSYLFLDDVLTQDGQGLPPTWGKIVNANGGLSSGDPVPANYAVDPNVVNDPRYQDTFKDDLRTIPSLSLVMDPVDLWDESSGIYSNSLSEGIVWERPVSVEWIDTDGDVEFRIDAGARMHGGWGRRPSQTNKHSFRLLFKRDYGPTKLEYPLFGEEGPDEFDTIVLRANFNTSWANSGNPDATFVQDRWAAQTQAEMGWEAPLGNWVHLYVNGLYWGLYNPNERPNAAWAASHFGGEKDQYESISKGEAIDGTSRNYSLMLREARSSDVDYQALQEMLDIDAFIDYMIINQYGGNWDWPHNNWWATRRNEPGGKWYFHSWDAEGVWSNLNENRVTATGGPGDIFLALKESVPDFRMRYADRIQMHFFNGGLLTPEANIDRLQRLTAPIDRAVVGESARWGDGRWDQVRPARTRDDHWLPRLGRLERTYFPRRNGVVIRQYERAAVFPDTEAPALNQHGDPVAAGFRLTMANPGQLGKIYYTLNGADPRRSGGDLSPDAIEYDGSAIVVGNALLVRARVLNDGEWSPLTETTFEVGDLQPGDIDANGLVNLFDVDRLCQQLVAGEHEASSDLTLDGVLNRNDHAALVEEILQLRYGDANQDGIFDSSDLVKVFQSGRYNMPELGTALWSMGDWNCDQAFDSGDFVQAFQRGRYIPIPE